MVKMSSFVIALILVGLISAGFGIFMGEFNDKYPRSDYNATEFQDFNKLSELSSEIDQTRNATEIDVNPGITDIIGSYFGSAYQALRVSVGSVSIFESLSETAAEKSGISHIGLIKGALVSIVIVLVFIGIFISAMVKKDV